MAHMPFNAMLFDKMIVFSGGFLIYVADAAGYSDCVLRWSGVVHDAGASAFGRYWRRRAGRLGATGQSGVGALSTE